MLKNNSIWGFFASVKLALITLIILAVVSIIGTLVKQGQDLSYYAQEYGAALATLFEATDINNMYNSWWFVALLCLFAINLIVCSIERLPRAFRQAFRADYNISPNQMATFPLKSHLTTNATRAKATEEIRKVMQRSGWRNLHQENREEATLVAAQKYAWSRLGVYLVHLSILIILIGAITGSVFGFQAYVFIQEGGAVQDIYMRKTKEKIPLGFQLRNERFEKTYYPNGMVQQYRADLAVFDEELEEPFRKSIIVNDPLTHEGLSFFMGDSYPTDAIYVILRNQKNGMERTFRLPPQQEVNWAGTDVSFRIDELERNPDGFVQSAKIRFTAGNASPSVFWMHDRTTVSIPDGYDDYLIYFRQLHSVLLLITKDPGVWMVYTGFVLMLIGLMVSFFLSHKRIWVHIEPHGEKGSQILLAGASNKHKQVFEQQFMQLTEQLKNQMTSQFVGKK